MANILGNERGLVIHKPSCPFSKRNSLQSLLSVKVGDGAESMPLTSVQRDEPDLMDVACQMTRSR